MGIEAEDFGKVAVLLGGRSAEREVSLRSGAAVLAGLHRRGVNAHALDAATDDLAGELREGGFDRVFLILHGRGGEDGQIQGMLEILGIPYTGSGVAGSALGMDKFRCKLLWRGLGLPTPEFVMIHTEADLERVSAMGFPVMVKPIHEGSSIGVTRAENPEQLRTAWEAAKGFDREVLAEQWIDGRELTAGILGDQPLPLIRLETPRQFYDYEAKYHADSTLYHCPCGLDEATETKVQALALDAFQAVDARHWGRVDLFLDRRGEPWLIEINTAPGMTDHSLVPMAAKAAGMDFDELVWRILAMTLES